MMPSGHKRRAREEPLDSPPARRHRSASQSSAGSNTGAATPDLSSFSSHDVMVKRLVRLALASEVARRPISRQDITQKVLDTGRGRSFKRVFEDANNRLQSIFGMMLTELPQKDKLTLVEKRAAQKSGRDTQERGSAASASSGLYVLINILPEPYRCKEIISPPKHPSTESEAGYSGLATFIVTAIMLSNGQRLSQGKLESYLQQANAGDLVFEEKTEQIMKRLQNDRYIRKIKEQDASEEIVDFVVGPRGKTEVGTQGAAGAVRAVWNIRDGELQELENAMERTLGKGTFQRTARRSNTQPNGDEGDNQEAQNNDHESSSASNNEEQERRTRGRTRGSQARARAANDVDHESDDDNDGE